MPDNLTPQEVRIEVVKAVANALSQSSPELSKRLLVLANNPGPPEHFQKLALEQLALASEGAVLELAMLVKAMNAIRDPTNNARSAILLAQQMDGVYTVF
jgi:hypothetical protein